MKDSNVKRATTLQLILLVLVTASIRYAFVHRYGIPGARDDAAIYSVSAEHIASYLKGNTLHQPEILGTILRDRGPVYPCILALAYLVSGIRPDTPIHLNILCECLSVILVFLIGNRLAGNIGLIAASLFAVSIPNIGMTRYIMTESPVTLLVLLSMFLLNRNQFFLSGLAGALAYFAKPSLMIWPLILFASAFLMTENRKRSRALLQLGLGIMLVVLPVRSILAALPMSDRYWSSRSAAALYHGYNQHTEAWAIITGPGSNAKPTLDDGLRVLRESFPFDTLRMVLTKFGRLWKIPFIGQDMPWMPDRPNGFTPWYWLHGIALFLACWTFPRSLFSRSRFLIAAGLGGLTLLIVATYAIPRYAVILLPMVYLLAADAVIARPTTRRDLLSGTAGICIFLCLAVAHHFIDVRDVEWISLEKGKPIEQSVDIPADRTGESARIWLDLRLLQAGQAGVIVRAGDSILDRIDVHAANPWESPLWKTIDWNAPAGRTTLAIELIDGSAPIALSRGDMRHVPGELRSYGRWSVLGDERIPRRTNLSRGDRPGILVEMPAGSGIFLP